MVKGLRLMEASPTCGFHVLITSVVERRQTVLLRARTRVVTSHPWGVWIGVWFSRAQLRIRVRGCDICGMRSPNDVGVPRLERPIICLVLELNVKTRPHVVGDWAAEDRRSLQQAMPSTGRAQTRILLAYYCPRQQGNAVKRPETLHVSVLAGHQLCRRGWGLAAAIGCRCGAARAHDVLLL